MLELYKYQITNGDHVEAISVDRLTEGTRISVSDIIDVGSEDEDEQITSIVLPLNEVKPLIEGLLKATDKNAPLLLAVDAHQLAVLYSALVMLIEQMQGEVIQEKIPYELASDLKTRLTDIVASNPTKFSEIGAIL